MVKDTWLLLFVTIGLCSQSIGCADPSEELCDQLDESSADVTGDGGMAMSFADSDTDTDTLPRFTPSDSQHRAALALEGRPSMFDADAPRPTFRSWQEDPRVPVTDEHQLQSYPFRTVVSVALSYKVGEGILNTKGTGFLAGPRHVITNRHVVEIDDVDVNAWLDTPPKFFSFNVFPGRSNLAVLNGGVWAVERVVRNPFPGFPYNDYVILVLEDDIERSGQYGRMGLCRASSGTLNGLPVVTAGYPAAAYTCGQTPDPPDGDNECPCGGWMYTQSCEVSKVNPRDLLHTCQTQKGQSGSPLWVDECDFSNTRCAVGIIYGKSGLSPAAVRWRDEDVDWLQTNICQWTSDYAEMPPFCD